MDLSSRLEALSTEFDERVYQRHVEGAEKYGAIKFLSADVTEELSQELLDIANYAKYLYIKLHLFQEVLRESGLDSPSEGAGNIEAPLDGVPSPATSFIPAGSLSEVLSRARGLEGSG